MEVHPRERELPFPCDRHLADHDGAYWRAIDVEAPAPLVFRWLCQLRVTPYSYDLLDNLGRRSPPDADGRASTNSSWAKDS